MDAGIFSVLQSQIFKGIQTNNPNFQIVKIRQQITLNPNLASKRFQIVHIFISGIRSNKADIDLNIPIQPDYSKGMLTFALNITKEQLYNLQVLDLTYLIYTPGILKVSTQLNLADHHFDSIQCQEGRQKFTKQQFYGFTGINSQKMRQYHELVKKVKANQPKRRLLSFGSSEAYGDFLEYYRVSGLTLDVDLKIFTEAPVLQIQQPESCLPNQIFSEDQSQTCQQVCKSQEIYTNGICLALNFHYPTLCKEHQKYDLKSNVCGCENGYRRKNMNNSSLCEKVCKQNQFFNPKTNTCGCKNGNLNNDGQCVECNQVDNQVWNRSLKKCECIPHFYLLRGKCRRCSANAYFQAQKCVCKEGYAGNGEICRPHAKQDDEQPTFLIKFI